MTPTQKIKWALLLAYNNPEFDPGQSPTGEKLDELYGQFMETDDYGDVESEFRGGEFVTDIPSDYSRHYESRSVAAKMPDGTYVGWTYWYGGGKHGDPGEMPWIENAYDVDLKEEEKLVMVQTWTKKA